MRKFLFISFFVLVWSIGYTQSHRIDSLKRELSVAKEDSTKIHLMKRISNAYTLLSGDSSMLYEQKAMSLIEKIKFSSAEVGALTALGDSKRRMGEIPEALELTNKALQLAINRNDLSGQAGCYSSLGLIFYDLEEYAKAISYFQIALKMNEASGNRHGQIFHLIRIGYSYFQDQKYDSAKIYIRRADRLWERLQDQDPLFYAFMGDMYFHFGEKQQGFEYLQTSIRLNEMHKYLLTGSKAHIIIAGFFKEIGQRDSAILHATEGLSEAKEYGVARRILEATNLLAKMYEPTDLKKAFYYLKMHDSADEELYGRKKVQDLQKTLSAEQDRKRQNELKQVVYQNQIKLYSLLAGLAIFLIVGLLLFRNNLQKQRANSILEFQKKKIESTLSELKSTQAQLIQSEKMASLGELTAGIAHEIQNPLNFVNNFSEINKELIDEASLALKAGNPNGAVELLSTLRENEDKISNHGKRADRIVKGMLQHSRETKGQKEPTDLNYLADEYFKLSYQGQRAKDKSFNATLKTDFDSSIGKINLIPQDIGRVLLNLYNNAFYVVSEKKKQIPEGYEPTVSVSTKKMDGKIEIRVNDNGNGIPEKVREKIFQPFFTTKPTGQGTGLGLSLSYDIIKAHGGEIKVETKEREFTEFVIQLPISVLV